WLTADPDGYQSYEGTMTIANGEMVSHDGDIPINSDNVALIHLEPSANLSLQLTITNTTDPDETPIVPAVSITLTGDAHHTRICDTVDTSDNETNHCSITDDDTV